MRSVVRSRRWKNLTEVPEGWAVTIMSDEFFNVYDKTGQETSDYKPYTTEIYRLTPLDRDLRSHFHHPSGRDLEVVGGALGSTCGPGIASSPCLLMVKHQR